MTNGVIAVPCGEQARWSAFWGCLAGLDRPVGWTVEVARGCSPARNRNLLAARALEQGAEWIFWLDDDLTFRPDLLTRLLRHEVEAVCALSLRRQPPFEPLWFSSVDGTQPTWAELPSSPKFLLRIAGCTSGGLLTHRSVFERMPSPWWTLGQIVPDEWQDDIWWCRQLAAAGISLWGDPQARCGHLTAIEVWPHEEQGWHTVLARGSTAFASLAIPSTPSPAGATTTTTC